MEYKNIILSKENHIATITLNRPDKMNALNEKMTEELANALVDIGKDDNMRVLVITGSGRTFCAGADLREEEGEAMLHLTHAESIRRAVREMSKGCIEGLVNLPQPTIAMVNGACVGAGFDLALACDLRVGSDKARFMVAYSRVGIIPGQGGAWMLAKIAGLPKAAELLFTGDFLNAEDAEKWGVINKLVPASDLEKETMAMATRISKMPPLAVRINKMHLYRMLQMDLASALDFAAATQPILLTSEDYQEAVKSFMEKREGVYKGR
jgi:enoyl-CoA hydratase/carnithine racemase